MSEIGLSLYEPVFTHGDVVKAAGVPSKSLQNWLARGNLKLQYEHYSDGGGRRLYAPIDIIVIAVMAQLTSNTSISTSSAFEIGGKVALRAVELFDKRSQPFMDGYGPENPVFLIITMNPCGEPVYYEINHSDRLNYNLDFSHIVVPSDRICFRTYENLFDLLEAENPESLSHLKMLKDRNDSSKQFMLKQFKISFAEDTIKLHKLQQKIRDENRKPNPDEMKLITDLTDNIDRAKQFI